MNYLVYDIGVLSNYNDSAWEAHVNLPFTRGVTGTTVTNNTDSHQHLFADITSGTAYDFTPPFIIKFNFEKLGTGNANSTIRLFD